MASRAVTTKEFSTMMQGASDYLSLIVRAHHSIEARIQEALEHELPRANALELRRVAFLLKVDFLVAMGIFHPKFRALFEQVNSIRNRFAHDPYAMWDSVDGAKVKSSIKAIDPTYPCEGYDGDSLKVLLHVVFDYATRKYNDRIAESLRAETFQEMMTDPAWQERVVPGHGELPPIPEEMMKEVTDLMNAEVESRIKKKLASRETSHDSTSKT
jgi:hypothetical protein